MKKNLKNCFIIIALFFLAFFEANFLFHFSFWPKTPVIFILFVFFLVFSSGEKEGLIWAALAGLFMDFASSQNFGIFFLSFVSSAYFLKKISGFFKSANGLVFTALLAVFFVSYKAFFYFWNFAFNFLI